jgi:hypothetical protein
MALELYSFGLIVATRRATYLLRLFVIVRKHEVKPNSSITTSLLEVRRLLQPVNMAARGSESRLGKPCMQGLLFRAARYLSSIRS